MASIQNIISSEVIFKVCEYISPFIKDSGQISSTIHAVDTEGYKLVVDQSRLLYIWIDKAYSCYFTLFGVGGFIRLEGEVEYQYWCIKNYCRGLVLDDSDGQYRPVAYYCKKNNDTE